MALLIRNRTILEKDLATIRSLIAAEGAQGRTHLSRRLCRLWDWRQLNGAFREIACRDLLRQLHRRQLISLPPQLGPARRPGYKNRVRQLSISTDPVHLRLDQIQSELTIMGARSTPQRDLLRDLIGAGHYLGYQQPTGPSLGYLFFWQDRPLGCARFGPAAWKVAARDAFIGWTPAERRARLHAVVNNDRFLILNWVHVPGLASFVLSQMGRRLARDWHQVYRQSIVLAETFVDTDRFTETSYRAAHWHCVGPSQGRGRNDRQNESRQSIKSVWCYPLRRNFRRSLTGESL
jgi:hypothetical protein